MGCSDVSGLVGEFKMKKFVPWWLKLAVKLMVSRFPLGYAVWHRINLFVHGEMDKPAYAYGVFQRHLKQSGFNIKGKVVMELGPGDSLFSAITAKAFGAEKTYLVDIGPYASADMDRYYAYCALLNQEKLDVSDLLEGVNDLDSLMRKVNGFYLTEGLQSLKSIPDQSVDFIFSHAVLEHVSRETMMLFISETARILKPDGVCSHTVDLTDHLGGNLNNLRFQEKIWESSTFTRAGFYTNRIRHCEFVDIFEHCGYDIKIPRIERWALMPTPVSSMVSQFRIFPTDELRIKGFDVIGKVRMKK
jgi:SAM-dependent methyltransferase